MRVCAMFIILTIVGCRSKTDRERLDEFVNDESNKVTQKITVGNTSVTSKWLPSNYRAIKMLGMDLTEDSQQHSSYAYYMVRFDKNGGQAFEASKTAYLDFDIGQDFTMVTAIDSLAPVICQRVANGRTDSYEYLLAFSKGEEELKDRGATLVYKDKMFSIGTIAFVYNKEIFQQLPVIKKEKIDDPVN